MSRMSRRRLSSCRPRTRGRLPVPCGFSHGRNGRGRALTLLTWLTLLLAGPSLFGETVRDLVARGDQAVQRQDFAAAIRLYDEARGMVDPAHNQILAGLLFKKAIALRGAGDVLSAIVAVESAQGYHRDDAFEALRADLDHEAIERGANAQQITKALAVAKGFPPTSAWSASVSVWVEFEFDSALLTSRGTRQLGEMAEAMASDEFRGKRFLLIGHTDRRGPESYNLSLSERRAHTLWERLVDDFGIDGARVDAEGRGESEPRAQGDSESAHARNRRVELKLQ